MEKVFSEDCLSNVLGHIKNCWNYYYPNGKVLESAVYSGIKKFHTDSKLLGAVSTIVDVLEGDRAYDIKGRKAIRHVKKVKQLPSNTDNVFTEQNIPNIGTVIVRRPKSIMTQVQRPSVNLQNYSGDPEKILQDQIENYNTFANETMRRDGCNRLFSMVVLYGFDVERGIKSIFLNIEPFYIPRVVKYTVGVKKNGEPCSYNGVDEHGNMAFTLSSFNANSANLYKRFYLQDGILMSWAHGTFEERVFSSADLSQECAIKNTEIL